MRIELDGKPYLSLQSSLPTLGEALIEIDQHLQANGRAMQTIEVDGHDIPADELTQEMANRAGANIGELKVSSASLSALVLEAIDEVEAVLPELPVACQALATVFAGDEPNEGLAPLVDLLDIWDGLRETRERVVGALSLDFSRVPFVGKTVGDYEMSLEAMIGRLHAAVEKKDFRAAADMIAYDLNTFAEQEPGLFKELRARCDAAKK